MTETVATVLSERGPNEEAGRMADEATDKWEWGWFAHGAMHSTLWRPGAPSILPLAALAADVYGGLGAVPVGALARFCGVPAQEVRAALVSAYEAGLLDRRDDEWVATYPVGTVYDDG